jgi:hypothetical protein
MERRQFLKQIGALAGIAAGGAPVLHELLSPVPQDEPAFVLKSTWGNAEMIDVTSMDCDGYREFLGGFRDGGEVTMRMNFDRNQEWEEFVNGSA